MDAAGAGLAQAASTAARSSVNFGGLALPDQRYPAMIGHKALRYRRQAVFASQSIGFCDCTLAADRVRGDDRRPRRHGSGKAQIEGMPAPTGKVIPGVVFFRLARDDRASRASDGSVMRTELPERKGEMLALSSNNPRKR
jgi:hypothetical protein